MAKECGISQGYLSLLEHGQRSPSVSVAESLVEQLYRDDAAAAAELLAGAVVGRGRDYLLFEYVDRGTRSISDS